MKAPTVNVNNFFNIKKYSKNIYNYELDRKINIILKTIRIVESNEDYYAVGKCGEIGAYQIMPNTWKLWCYEVYGTIKEPTKQNQDTIVYYKLNKWIDKYTIKEIALLWNAGTVAPKRLEGFNKYNVYFNINNYIDKFLKVYNYLSE